MTRPNGCSNLGPAALAVALLAAAVSCGSPGAVRHPGGPQAAPARVKDQDRLLGPTSPDTALDFSVTLRMHQGAIARYIRHLYDPASPAYHHFLTPAGYGARFGLPMGMIGDVLARLRAAGLAVTASFPQRTALGVHGTAAAVSGLFHVTLRDYLTPEGDRYHAPAGLPHIPPSLAHAVVGLSGLNSRILVRPAGAVRDVPVDGLKPIDAAKAYDVAPLWDSGIRGDGQTVAIVSFANYLPADLAEYERQFGIGGPAVEHVKVAGGTTELGEGSIEANLDLDVVRGIAPQARVLFFEAPKHSTFGDVFNAIVADGRATIVSMSWAGCDIDRPAARGPPAFLDPAERAADQQAIDAAVVQGISIFISSGDWGAYTCHKFNDQDERPTVSWPCSSVGVVCVGGTLLSVRRGGGYLRETAWEDVVENAGGGGGLNPQDPLPPWQVGPGVQEPGISNGNRQLPDVAAAADNDSGFYTVFTDPDSGERVSVPIGGTSAAAPFWAGSMALVQQAAARAGVGTLGFVDPMLYQLGATTQAVPPFHDVTRGRILLYRAGPGWDFATGLGSPDVANLAADAVAYLRQHPA